MAITISHNAANDVNTTTDATSFSTASFTVNDGELLVVFVHAAADNTDPTVQTWKGLGLIEIIKTAVGTNQKIWMYAKRVGAGEGGAGVCTFTWAVTRTSMTIVPLVITGHDASGLLDGNTIKQRNSNSDTTGTQTSLSVSVANAITAGSATIAIGHHIANQVSDGTDGGTWTEVADYTTATPNKAVVVSQLVPSTDGTWVNTWATASNCGSILAEIKAATDVSQVILIS